MTRGVGVAADQTYPSALQRNLPDVELINAGLAGNTIADTLARIDELRAFNSDLLLLNIGANDVARGVYREPEMLGADRLHPNEEGYARIAENVLHGMQAIGVANHVEARMGR